MVAIETLEQTGDWGRRRKLWMVGASLRSPKGSWESLALEGPARGGKMRGVFGGWVSCMALLSGWKDGPAWCDAARGRQARACRGLYKLCLKRMQKVLLPVCKIETGYAGSAPASCSSAGALTYPRGMPGLYQIRRLLAVAAAAARARVMGTLVKKGMEGPPPLPGSAGSQIFVVGGGASELVVLVVVSGT